MKLGVRNITQYSGADVSRMPLPAFFPPTFTSSLLSAMFTEACGPPEKLESVLYTLYTFIAIFDFLNIIVRTTSHLK